MSGNTPTTATEVRKLVEEMLLRSPEVSRALDASLAAWIQRNLVQLQEARHVVIPDDLIEQIAEDAAAQIFPGDEVKDHATSRPEGEG